MNNFPNSIICKKPKFSMHRGRTWDQCDVFDLNGNKLVGYLDTTWGSYFYFRDGDNWRKAKTSEYMLGKENTADFRISFDKNK